MTRKRRIATTAALIAFGLAAQTAIEAACRIERPRLRQPLSTLPMVMGDWAGVEAPVSKDLVRESNADEYLSRIYESPRFPGLPLKLWINYSNRGANLFHSPEICMPAGGWSKIESLTSLMDVPDANGTPIRVSRLSYSQGELVGNLGFWYYIFGEGQLEDFVRSLTITSQSSYGRVTRGSSVTFEVFYPGERDLGSEALQDFVEQVIRHSEPILPINRAGYFLP